MYVSSVESRGQRGRRVLRTAAVRPGPGSYRLLGWLGRLGVAGIEPMQLGLGLSRAVTYKHVARLADAGLVVHVATCDGGGGAVAITRAGARVAREREAEYLVSPRSTAPSSAVHGRAVSWVAAAAEVRDLEWLAPAELSSRGLQLPREDGARHAPDLVYLDTDRRTAVEVELHRKDRTRLRAILQGYRELVRAGELDAVSYVTGRDDIAALIRSEGEQALLGAALAIGPLQGVIARTQEIAAERRQPSE
jgi:hypothetical protein